jgi:hypothetical protein
VISLSPLHRHHRLTRAVQRAYDADKARQAEAALDKGRPLTALLAAAGIADDGERGRWLARIQEHEDKQA